METNCTWFGFPWGEERNHLHIFVFRIEMSHSPLWTIDDSESSSYTANSCYSGTGFSKKHLETNPIGNTIPLLRGHGCFSVTSHPFLLLLTTLAWLSSGGTSHPTTQVIYFGWGSPQLWDGACDLGISQSANYRHPATIIGSGINSSAEQKEEDTMRILWGLLGGQQVLPPLDLDLQEDQAGNTVTLPWWDESLPRIEPKIHDVKQRERNNNNKNLSLDKFPLLNPTMPEDPSISIM